MPEGARLSRGISSDGGHFPPSYPQYNGSGVVGLARAFDNHLLGMIAQCATLHARLKHVRVEYVTCFLSVTRVV